MSVHSVYVMHDADGTVLYVGCTADPGARLDQHRRGSEFWADVATVEVTHYPTREDAIAAEAASIRDLKPLCNRSLAERSGDVRQQGMYGDIAVGALIRSTRRLSGMNQIECATALGVTSSHLANIERGARNVTPHLAKRLSEVLGLKAETVLTGLSAAS